MSTNSIGLLLITALVTCALLSAQDQPPSDDLKIIIVSGDGFTNNVKKRTAREEIVEVRDRNNSPVPGAIVTFSLLSQGGAGGSFTANSANLVTVTTDQAGRAVTMFKPNGVAGSFKINVSASFQGRNATTSLTQTNTVAAAGAATAGGLGGLIASHAILTAVVVGAVAATAASVAVVTNGSSSRNAKVSVGPPSLP